MTIISLVVVVDEQNGMGNNNQLLCHLPADLKHFKQVTAHYPIIMGRKTFEAIGRPLPGRQNIVISRKKDFSNVIMANSLQEAIQKAEDKSEIMIIGGAQIFNEALPLANQIYLTQIHHTFDADVFFPKLNISEWDEIEIKRHDQDDKNKYSMTFYLLKRRKLFPSS